MWTAPKTDWKATYDAAGNFEGDWINLADYNRIKNNLAYLRDLADGFIYGVKDLGLGADKASYLEYSYADEWNAIEDGLSYICGLVGVAFSPRLYYENGPTIDYSELNRIERMELQLYGQLTAASDIRKRLAVRLGTKASIPNI